MRDLLSKRTKTPSSDAMSKFVLAQDPEVISFAGGLPDNNLFPIEEIKICQEEMLEKEGKIVFQYSSSIGDTNLRSWIGEEFFIKWGKTVPIENIIITEGSQQALDLIGKLLLDPDDYALIESPGYLGTIQAWRVFQSTLIGISQDEKGINLEELEETIKKLPTSPKVLYVVPDFSNPAGTCLPLERRKKLIDLAEKYKFYIVEDLAYSLLAYDEDTLPPLLTLKDSDYLITIGSFSKILSPGLRTGFIVAPKDLIRPLRLLKEASDLCCGTYAQKLIYYFCKNGFLKSHLERLKTAYKVKRDKLKEALKTYFSGKAVWNNPSGGFFFFLTFPENMDCYNLAEKALENKTSFVPGEEFFVNGKGKNTARISFSQTNVNDIFEGVRRLLKAWEELQE
ncbi:MAG: PLP-dependent aminotransferase family protein [Dictyoglomus sp.]|nr:PLP-dependent aminotransferase family protein [Dictyoglomus sp.]MDW8187720.1 PLP-dependent aminotransferase family protein [Dictyoglomus sp.]